MKTLIILMTLFVCDVFGQQKNIVALGDSLTAGYYNSFGADSYPFQLGQYFPGSMVSNYGIPGETSSGVLTTEIPQIVGMNYPGWDNIFILWIGYNGWDQPNSLSVLQANVINIISQAKNLGFKTMILTLTPSLYALQGPTFPQFRESQNQWILSGQSSADIICNS